MLVNRRRIGSGSRALAVVGLAGFLTWLCASWIGGQPPLTAVVAVILVQLMLAGFGLIAVLLTERLTVALLNAEKRTPVIPKARPRRMPLWRRLPEGTSVAPVAADPATPTEIDVLAFPQADERPPTPPFQRFNRAA